ncbi:MAG: hypothetical protein WCI11_12325 [Candidatus Methylumidiphilus sp.]
MFDDLIKQQQHKNRKSLKLTEWAKYEGWISDIEELPPYFITRLATTARDQATSGNLIKIQSLEKDSSILTTVINDAIKANELTARQVDFYQYDWPFNALDFPSSSPALYQITKKGITSPNYKPLWMHIITKEDFKEWLIKLGKWPLGDNCLLNEWLGGNKTAKSASIERDTILNKLIIDAFELFKKQYGNFPSLPKELWNYLLNSPNENHGFTFSNKFRELHYGNGLTQDKKNFMRNVSYYIKKLNKSQSS